MATKTKDPESNHIMGYKDPVEVKNILLSKAEALQDKAIGEYKEILNKATYNNVRDLVSGLISLAEDEKRIMKKLKDGSWSKTVYFDGTSGSLENSLFEHLLDQGEKKPKENDISAIIMYALNISTKLNTLYYLLLNEYSHSAIKNSFRALQEIESNKIKRLDKLYEALVVKGAY
ncbi:MAG: hypothetical protein QXW10_02735 [Candidatus Micrarchaeaceae archaeon]